MELTKERTDELKEYVSSLEKKYEAITTLLEQIDSEMTEFYVIIEDLNHIMSQM